MQEETGKFNIYWIELLLCITIFLQHVVLYAFGSVHGIQCCQVSHFGSWMIACILTRDARPSLGATMKKCVVLACTHFFFGVVYSLGVMLLDPGMFVVSCHDDDIDTFYIETAGFLVLLVIFPLAITMSAFYVWIFSSLGATISTLGKYLQQSYDIYPNEMHVYRDT